MGSARRTCFDVRGVEFSGKIHGDDFVVTGPTDRLADLKNKIAVVYPMRTKNPQSRLNRKHPSAEQKTALEKPRSGVSARSQTC